MKNEIKELSYSFGVDIVKHHSKIAGRGALSLGLQLLRSGTAVGALYREAEYAQSRADFINKLSVARKECNESLYWLQLLHDTDFIVSSDYKLLSQKAGSLLNLLTAIIQTTRANTPKPTPRSIRNP
jgi:four helix bundle protein